MIVELSVVEQRYQAVLEVLNNGATVTDVARRYGVARQTVHWWMVRRDRCRVRIRCQPRLRLGSSRCAVSMRVGAHVRSGINCPRSGCATRQSSSGPTS